MTFKGHAGRFERPAEPAEETNNPPSKGESRRLATIREMMSPQRRVFCCDLVGRAEKLALSCPDQSLSVSAICRSLAVSERTLRKAFNEIHGVPPCRRLRMSRLLHARKVLLAADRELTTVTKVATALGFSELGRFSVEYRRAFGESPSQTLNGRIQTCCIGAERDVDATSRPECA